MANNSDGGIVLSVNIDSSEVSSDMKKLTNQITKAVKSEKDFLTASKELLDIHKNITKEAEKTAKAKGTTPRKVIAEDTAGWREISAYQKAEQEKAKYEAIKSQTANKELLTEQKIINEKSLGEQRIANLKDTNEQKIANARQLNDQKVENSRLQSEERIKGVQQRNAENLSTLEKRNADDVATKKILNTDRIATQSVLNTNKIAEAERLSEDKIATQKAINEEKIRQENAKTAELIQKNNTQQILDEEKKKQAVEKTKQEILKTKKAQNSLKNATSKTTTFLRKMASTLGIAFGVRQLITFSNEASKLASTTEASVQRLSMLYGESAQDVYDWANENANALGMSKTAAYQAAAAYGNIFTTFADGKESADLTKDVLQATAVIASQTGRTYDETFEKIQSGLYGNTRAIDDLGISVRQSSLMQTEAYKQVSQNGQKSWNDLTDAELQQVRALAIVEQSTTKYGNSVLQTTALTRSQFSSAWEDFKSTWGQVVNVILMPILSVATKIISYITSALQALLKVFGKEITVSNNIADNYSQASNSSENLSDNIDDATSSQKKYNKELNKSLAGFDELQTLQLDKPTDDVATSSGGGTGAIGGVATPTTVKYEVKGVEEGEDNSGEVISKIAKVLGDILEIAGTMLIAIGLIMLFMGNIPMGIGLLIAGVMAKELSQDVKEVGSSDDPVETLKAKLKELKDQVAKILLALGVICLLFGHLPIGIGLIIAGAVAFNVKEEKEGEWDQKSFEEKLGIIEQAVAAALFIIGVILLMLGNLPLGLGAIALGAATFGVAKQNLDESQATTKIDKFIKDNSALLIGVGAAMLVIGILVLFISGGTALPLGLALILLGVGLIVAPIIVNWEFMKKKVLGWINAIFAIVSTAALVIGIIMLCTGQITPLSIGLVVVGAVGLVTEVAVNWEFLKKKLQGWIGVVTGIVSGALLVLGIIILVASGGTALALGLSLIIAGAAGLVTVVAANWNGIIDKVKEIWRKIKLFWDNNVAKYFTLAWWKNLGKTIINGLISSIEKGLNFIIDKINTLSWKIPDWVPKIGGGTFGFNIRNVSIPRLAKGAVIPANREFLAVLGDQKSGTNIEAPAKLIKQMAKEAILELGVQGQTNAQTVIPTINVPVYLNGRQIALAQRQAEQELGKQIVSGGFANAY